MARHHEHESIQLVRKEFTWEEWLEYATAGIDKGLSSDHINGGNFHFGKAGKLGKTTHILDTIDVARREGWRDAIPDADKLVAKIEADLGESMQNDFVTLFDVSGAEVDMGRFMTGEPECMRESVPMKVKSTGRIIKIAVPVCYPAMVSADTVKRRGAAVMALVNAFTMHQHTVEVHAVIAIEGRKRNDRKDRRLSYSIVVQDADAPLDMGRIMYALAHPTMLRQLGFAAEHNEDDEAKRTFDIGGSYGHPSYAAIVDDLNINVENAIILPPLMSDYEWDSEEKCVAWIRKQMEILNEGMVG